MNIDAASYVTGRITDAVSGDNGAMNVDNVGTSSCKVDRAITNDESCEGKAAMEGNVPAHQKYPGSS